MKRLLLIAAIGCSCGDEKDQHDIHVPEQKAPIIHVQPVLETDPEGSAPIRIEAPEVNFTPPEVIVPPSTVVESKKKDPPGIDFIEFARVKCEVTNIPGKQAYFCIYGLKVLDADNKEHTKYYSCLITGPAEPSCNPIELF